MVRQNKGSRMEWVGVTTVMIRNIPSCYTQQALVEELCALGFQGAFDFFYLPFDMKTKKTNMGYAFMNCKSEALVLSLVAALDGMPLERSGRKVLRIVPAQTQGYEANLVHFAHSAVLNHHKSEFAPLFLREDAPLPGWARTSDRRKSEVLPEGTTTLTLRLLTCGQPALYLDLCARGFGSHVDFVHVHCGTGTVNFTTPDAAKRAAAVLEGTSVAGSSRLRVAPAPLQGCGTNIVYFATIGLQKKDATVPSPPVPAPAYLEPLAKLARRKQTLDYRPMQYTCPGTPPLSATPPLSPPLSDTKGRRLDVEVSEPTTPKDARSAKDLERCLTSFPWMLSSPACTHLPGLHASCSSGSTSSGTATPPLVREVEA